MRAQKGNYGEPAVLIGDSATAASIAKTVIKATGQYTDGIDVADAASMTIDGSQVSSQRAGVAAQGLSTLKVNNANLTGGQAGLLVIENPNVTVAGGVLMGTGSPAAWKDAYFGNVNGASIASRAASITRWHSPVQLNLSDATVIGQRRAVPGW